MLTLKDIELMEKHFATKKELIAGLTNYPKNDQLDCCVSEFKIFLSDIKREITTEIRKLRQETDVNSSFRSKIEKQDQRIDRLEVAVFSR